MGKKKDKKKGHGAEKTASKTDKKLSKKEKKDLAARGEDDIESILAELTKEDERRIEVTVCRCSQPSPRSNMTLCAHPERPELFMFGGEYCSGNKTFLYNHLFLYNMKKQEWSQITSPNTPPPRCSHQAVMLPQGGGQMWVFGGEFASPTQSQFYHYKDLWVFHVRDCRWEHVQVKGGPSARSGHRMVAFRKSLIVFGGFHDNLREYKYYNDVHIFNLETRIWTKIEPSGISPLPRSACHLWSHPDSARIVMWAGYSKEQVKKEVEKGIVHSDMYALTLEDKRSPESAPLKWKWQLLKPGGDKPCPRSGAASVALGNNRVMLFGGVVDVEDDEETLESQFYNDQYIFDMEKSRWHLLQLNGPKAQVTKEAQHKEVEDAMETDEPPAEPQQEEVVHDDGVFTLRIGPSGQTMDCGESEASAGSSSIAYVPKPRMNCILAHKQNIVYLYGGLYEPDEKQVTLDDFYSLDTSSMTEWRQLSQGTYDQQVWEESDSSEDDSEEDSDADIE
ncbi:kelch domain-containing protein 4-like isoform X2 [Watersipora subatra]